MPTHFVPTRLTPAAYAKLRPLLQPLDHHLATQALLHGSAPGAVYVDDAAQPTAAFLRISRRYYLAGAPHDAFNRAVPAWLEAEAAAQGQSGAFVLYHAPGWEKAIEQTILRGRQPQRLRRHYYVCRAPRAQGAPLPPGVALHPVDAALLATEFDNLDALRAEMCSERPSVAAFLQHSFGVCAVAGNALAGWCLSEYNDDGRCEVGIETAPDFRQQGIATAMTVAFVNAAFDAGMRQVGWHCWAENVPSVKTALKAGFRLAHEETVYLARFTES